MAALPRPDRPALSAVAARGGSRGVVAPRGSRHSTCHLVPGCWSTSQAAKIVATVARSLLAPRSGVGSADACAGDAGCSLDTAATLRRGWDVRIDASSQALDATARTLPGAHAAVAATRTVRRFLAHVCLLGDRKSVV
jgi:hypothetical protein